MDPVFPLGELVCSLTMRLMPPGNEMTRFGLDTRTDWPAATKPTSSALPVTAACPLLHVALEVDFTTSAATKPPNRLRFATDDCDWLLVPLPDVVLFSASAEAKPKTLTLARDVFRFPPLAASGPVSERASEIPSAFPREATASPLNVVVACAKLATGLKAKIAVRQSAIVEFFFVFIVRSPLLQLSFRRSTAAQLRAAVSVGPLTVNTSGLPVVIRRSRCAFVFCWKSVSGSDVKQIGCIDAGTLF